MDEYLSYNFCQQEGSGTTAFPLATFATKRFQELLSWNLESKLITPKYITGTYFGAMVAILNFCDLGAGP